VSRENVDAVRAIYEGWAQGDFTAGTERYDRHIIYIPLGELPDSEARYIGLEGVREYMRGQLEAWTKLTIAAEELIEAGDSVVVAAQWRSEGQESGVPSEWRGFHVWTFRGRAVIRLELFRDRAEALEAVGLSE